MIYVHAGDLTVFCTAVIFPLTPFVWLVLYNLVSLYKRVILSNSYLPESTKRGQGHLEAVISVGMDMKWKLCFDLSSLICLTAGKSRLFTVPLYPCLQSVWVTSKPSPINSLSLHSDLYLTLAVRARERTRLGDGVRRGVAGC